MFKHRYCSKSTFWNSCKFLLVRNARGFFVPKSPSILLVWTSLRFLLFKILLTSLRSTYSWLPIVWTLLSVLHIASTCMNPFHGRISPEFLQDSSHSNFPNASWLRLLESLLNPFYPDSIDSFQLLWKTFRIRNPKTMCRIHLIFNIFFVGT